MNITDDLQVLEFSALSSMGGKRGDSNPVGFDRPMTKSEAVAMNQEGGIREALDGVAGQIEAHRRCGNLQGKGSTLTLQGAAKLVVSAFHDSERQIRDGEHQARPRGRKPLSALGVGLGLGLLVFSAFFGSP